MTRGTRHGWRRVLVVLLAVVLVGGAIPIFSVIVGAASYSPGDAIYFGNYPQSEVTAANLISTLNGLGGTAVSDTANGSTYIDVTYNGTTYRKVTRTTNSYRGDKYVAGSSFWFKYEPIKWRVLTTDSQGILVMAENVLDTRRFHNATTYPTWANSEVRTWLNSTFSNTAFSSSEKNSVVSATISTSNYGGYSGGANTTDKVFYLDRTDALNTSFGFSNSTDLYDVARHAKATDYSKARSVNYSTSSSTIYGGNSAYPLRSPGGASNRVSSVNDAGEVLSTNNSNVDSPWWGVRPAIYLTPDTNVGDGKETYTITYNANGGTGTPAAQTKTQGVPMTITTAKPSKNGYHFEAWMASSTLQTRNELYPSGSIYTVEGNRTLYALWFREMIFNANINMTADYGVYTYDYFAFTPPESGTYIFESFGDYDTIGGVGIEIYETDLTTDGKVDGGGESNNFRIRCSLIAGQTYICFAGLKSFSLADYYAGTAGSFYVRMTKEGGPSSTTSITYNANGGTGAPAAQSVPAGAESVTLSSTVPTREGYDFLGWSTRTYGASFWHEGITYRKSSDGVVDNSPLFTNVTLYAQWAEKTSEPIKNIKFDTAAGKRGVDILWNPSELFSKANNSIYDADLGVVASALSGAITNQIDIKNAFATIGHQSANTVYNTSNMYGWQKIRANGMDCYLITLVLRATYDLSDYITDGLGAFTNFPFSARANGVYNELRRYVEALRAQHDDMFVSNTKYFIVGHSLGGAIGDLVAHNLSENNSICLPSNIYCYTFGAPSHMGALGRVNHGDAKIFNFVNRADTIPFILDKPIYMVVPGFVGWAKTNYRFGSDEIFPENNDAYYNALATILGTTKADAIKYSRDRTGDAFTGAHAIELYVAWMKSRPDTNSFYSYEGALWGYSIKIECPVDIEIIDASGSVVGKIVNNTIVDTASEHISLHVDGDVKHIWVPSNEQYTVRITATEDGIMRYTTTDLGVNEETKIFQNIALSSGKTMEGALGGSIPVSETKLYVVDSAGDIMAEIQPNGTETPIPQPVKYIFSSRYESTPFNWFLFIICFGWIWMWF